MSLEARGSFSASSGAPGCCHFCSTAGSSSVPNSRAGAQPCQPYPVATEKGLKEEKSHVLTFPLDLGAERFMLVVLGVKFRVLCSDIQHHPCLQQHLFSISWALSHGQKSNTEVSLDVPDHYLLGISSREHTLMTCLSC